MKNQINKILNEACEKGLAEGVFSGVSAAVSRGKKGYRWRAFYSGGWTRSDDQAVMVARTTLFDLASLTKALCTTLCVFHLIETGKLHWKDSLASVWGREIPADKRALTIQQLLSHSSGLPAYKPYFQTCSPEYLPTHTALLVDKVIQEPLIYEPGSACLYSDLGFILLGAIIEQQTGTSLETLFNTTITDPLNLSADLFFRPLPRSPLNNVEKIAATEFCPWRGKIIQGEVHDEHCWLMGGKAGHAGLFGTIGGVMTICERILDIWQDRSTHPAFANRVLQYALSAKHTEGSWCLGFDTPTPGKSSSGTYFSPHSIGHLGFTGTSFWIDPDKDIIIVLLSNRIHPTRENTQIRQFRPFFHDVLMKNL
jgi:CubicO group peptidase (beta-lactamase class C family)